MVHELCFWQGSSFPIGQSLLLLLPFLILHIQVQAN